MRNFLLLAALLGGVMAAPANVEKRALVWETKEVVVTKTITLHAGQAGPTNNPPAPANPAPEEPVNAPAPEVQPSHTTAKPVAAASGYAEVQPAPKPTTTAAAAVAPPKPAAPAPVGGTYPANSGSSSGSSVCKTFSGMSNPLTGASESYCCTANKPCGVAQDAGAEATFYQMAGGTGACGQSLPDSAMFVAVNAQIMGSLSSGNPGNPLCGKTVVVKNTKTGKTAQGIVADKCPGCKTSFGIDLSKGVFDQLATESQGVFPVEWWFADL